MLLAPWGQALQQVRPVAGGPCGPGGVMQADSGAVAMAAIFRANLNFGDTATSIGIVRKEVNSGRADLGTPCPPACA